jgi:hypothetical protein
MAPRRSRGPPAGPAPLSAGRYLSGMVASATLRKKQADIEAFINALNALLQSLEPVQDMWGGPPRYLPRQGMESEAGRMRFEVDRVAGRAAYAFAEAGVFVDFKPRGTFQTQHVSPAQTWATILSEDPMFGLDVILACCSQALGTLDMRAEAAEEEERNPTPRAEPPKVRRVRASHLTPVVKWAASIAAAVIGAGIVYWLGLR